MKNLNKNIKTEKKSKIKKQGHCLKQKTRIAKEDVRSRWITKTGIRIWVPELRLGWNKIHKLKLKHRKQRKIYPDRARAKALSW